jgi:hypothetical protein
MTQPRKNLFTDGDIESQQHTEEEKKPSNKCGEVTLHIKAVFLGSSISSLMGSGIGSIPKIDIAMTWVSDHIPAPVTGILGNIGGSFNIDSMYAMFKNKKFKLNANLLASTALAAALIYYLQFYIPTAPVGEGFEEIIDTKKVSEDIMLAMTKWIQNTTIPFETYLHPETWFDRAQAAYVLFGTFQNMMRNQLRGFFVQGALTYCTKEVISPAVTRVSSCTSSLFNRAKRMVWRANRDEDTEMKYTSLTQIP